MPRSKTGSPTLKPKLSYGGLVSQLKSEGITRPMLVLLNLLLFTTILGGSMFVIGSQADASSGLTREQIRQAKQTAAAHFRHRGNICNSGQNIKLYTYTKDWPRKWHSVDPNGGEKAKYKYDALAYAYFGAGKPGAKGSTYCKVWFNDTLMKQNHTWHYPYFCTILAHEVGHLADYTYKKPSNGRRYRHNVDQRGSLMYPGFSYDNKEVKGCWGRWDWVAGAGSSAS